MKVGEKTSIGVLVLPRAAGQAGAEMGEGFAAVHGDDRAGEHHDVELMDPAGRRLTGVRLPEGVAGMARLHAMVAGQLGDAGDAEVVAGIETGRGLWVQALIAAGYTVLAVNPLQASRYRERLTVSGARSDAADAHMLADMVRTDSHQLRPVAGDSPDAGAIKVVARAHKTLIWDRTRQMQRLRHTLLDFFPAALQAFEDLDAAGTLELPARAPDPASAAKLTTAQISAALKRARRRNIAEKTAVIKASLRAGHLRQPDPVAAAYAATVRSQAAILTALNEQIKIMQGQVEAHLGQHPAAEILLSQPGPGLIPGARVLAESGDDPHRYAGTRARRNYAGTSPITRASGKKKTVTARYVHNDRLTGALTARAFTALTASPGARAYYDQLRAREISHRAALRQPASRLAGILHGCLKTGTPYDEATAWPQHSGTLAA
jgi:transposase